MRHCFLLPQFSQSTQNFIFKFIQFGERLQKKVFTGLNGKNVKKNVFSNVSGLV